MDTKYKVIRNGKEIIVERSDGTVKSLCSDEIVEIGTDDASLVVRLGDLTDAETVGYAFGLPTLKSRY